MEVFGKLLVFFIFFAVTGMTMYQAYRFLNQKIHGSRTGWELLLYSLVLILLLALLFFAGLFLLIKCYAFLRT